MGAQGLHREQELEEKDIIKGRTKGVGLKCDIVMLLYEFWVCK